MPGDLLGSLVRLLSVADGQTGRPSSWAVHATCTWPGWLKPFCPVPCRWCAWQVRKDHWKGMSPQQLAAIQQQQAAQLELKRAAEAAAAAAEADAVAHTRSVQRAVVLQAQAAEQARRQQAAAVAAALREQMAAKAAKDAQTEQLYANRVTDDFFAQFGRSHR